MIKQNLKQVVLLQNLQYMAKVKLVVPCGTETCAARSDLSKSIITSPVRDLLRPACLKPVESVPFYWCQITDLFPIRNCSFFSEPEGNRTSLNLKSPQKILLVCIGSTSQRFHVP